MLNETPSGFSKAIMSLKVAALAIVLSTVVIAAEHRLVSPGQTVAAATSQIVAQGDSTKQAAASDYFPAQFPAPKGEPSEPAPTF
jgi:hypothetical protein